MIKERDPSDFEYGFYAGAYEEARAEGAEDFMAAFKQKRDDAERRRAPSRARQNTGRSSRNSP